MQIGVTGVYNTLMFEKVSSTVNFPEIEQKILQWWKDNDIFRKYLQKNDKTGKRFSFLDGPITANNPMGVHHAWGRTYKDLWQRFYNMKGFKQRFQNGFDCQGLWVEVEVEKELGIRNKKDIENLIPGESKKSIAKFVDLCKERVIKYSTIQTEQSIRLGYFMDWGNSYYTMSDENNYMIWFFLKTCYEKGWIYKGKDSVPWCPRCETAISQHEMLTEDYKELMHETVFVKLPIIRSKFKFKTINPSLLIWTTTPWTVPANVAVGINTKFSYSLWKHTESDDSIIFMHKDDSGNVPTRALNGKELPLPVYIFKGLEGTYDMIQEIPGRELLGLKYIAPFDNLPIVKKAEAENPNKFHSVVDASEIVVSTEGTGLLHVAPGAGKEDFDLGKKESLPIISLIKDDASYVEGMDNFSGLNAKKHPELIIDHLKQLEVGRFLLKTLNYLHRYPACWRCKTELVWKVAEEWYIAMDRKEKIRARGKRGKTDKTLREQMMDTAKMINWHPAFGLERELDWLANMHDWLISKKNRYWGLALPIYECNKCRKFEVLGSKEELKNRAVEGWDKFEGHSPHKPFIDEVKIRCGNCGSIVPRLNDVGNVWLDAGIVPFSTYIDPDTKNLSYTADKTYWKQWFPAEFITESFPGQFKNWFYSMIAMSTVLEKRNPYKTVLGYASMLGEDGRPMHKSWGNAIEFHEGAEKIGVDVMRWMFVKHDPEQNLLFGYKKADETRRKFHLLLWNVYNFFITYANIHNFNPAGQKPAQVSSNILDRWIMSRLNNTIIITTSSLTSYDVKTAAISIEDFVTDLSQWYVRRSRGRVDIRIKDAKDMNSYFNTQYFVLRELCKLITPFVPFLAEEIYQNLVGKGSVQLEEWPEILPTVTDNLLEEKMMVARKIVELGHSLRKENKLKIRQPLSWAYCIEPEQKLKDPDIKKIILEELNIKAFISTVEFDRQKVSDEVVKNELEGYVLYINTKLDKKLVEEGQARDIVRKIQVLRKLNGLTLTEKIKTILPQWPKEFENYIKSETMSVELVKGSEISIIKQ